MVETEKVFDISKLKPLESKGVDLTEFEGARVKIAELKIVEVPSQYTDSKKQDCLKVISEAVTEIPLDDGNIEVRATELFNLTRDKETNELGWSKADNASLNKFLKKMKCNSPEDLIGKLVTIKTRTTKEGKTFLGIITE